MIETIIANYEVAYLKKLTTPADIEDQVYALSLDAAGVDAALEVCAERTQGVLWQLRLLFRFVDEDLDEMKRLLAELDVLRAVYTSLSEYKKGLKTVIGGAQYPLLDIEEVFLSEAIV